MFYVTEIYTVYNAIVWKDGATIGPAHEYWALSLTMASSNRWPTLINTEDEKLYHRLVYT